MLKRRRRTIARKFSRLAGLTERERAGRDLLGMPPPPDSGKEPDWKQQKREIRDAPMEKRPGT